MIDVIHYLEQELGEKLSKDQFLLAGNAFGKKSLFVYKAGNSYPSYVARIPHSQEGILKCENEITTLAYLDKIGFKKCAYPKFIGKYSIGDKSFYVQKVVKFRLLISDISMFRRTLSNKYFEMVSNTLIEIYHRTKRSIGGVEFCFQHGDFWAGNIGIWENNIVLLDFEFSTPNGRPLFDLLHFGLYFKVVSLNIGKVRGVNAGTIVDNRTFEPTYLTVTSLLLSNDALSKVMRKTILGYLEGCSIALDDGLALIKEYLEEDRKITGLPMNWEKNIFKNNE